MSEDRRLRDKLGKLAADEHRAGARRLAPVAGVTMTRAILEEIDETILPRTLAFEAPDGRRLALEVANRRLLGIAAHPDVAAGSDDPLLAPLPPEDDEAVAAVAAAIDRFAQGAGALTVAAVPLARAPGPGALGRSAAAIARVLGITLYETDPGVAATDPSEGFEAGLARLARAVAEVSGSAPGPASGPDAAAVARLSALDPEVFGRIAAGLGPEAQRADRFLLLAGEDEALFVGQTGAGRAVLALLPERDAAAAAALWTATRNA